MLIIILGIILFLGMCFLVLYAVNSQKTVFPNNTYIEQVDVSGATARDAAQKIANDFNEKEFKIVEINNTSKVLGTLTNFEFQYQLEDKIEPKLVWANMLSTFTSIYNGNVNLSSDVIPDRVTKTMINQIKNMDFVNDPKIVPTKNAYVDKSSTDFPIVPEVYGTSVNVEKLGKAIVEKIGNKEWQLEYEASKFYEQPTVKKDNADLTTLQKYCQKNLTKKSHMIFVIAHILFPLMN